MKKNMGKKIIALLSSVLAAAVMATIITALFMLAMMFVTWAYPVPDWEALRISWLLLFCYCLYRLEF